jgi:hypothetical protein
MHAPVQVGQFWVLVVTQRIPGRGVYWVGYWALFDERPESATGQQALAQGETRAFVFECDADLEAMTQARRQTKHLARS